MLDARHLSYAYVAGQTILHDVSLSLAPGETLYILGRNGSGKTSLLACLAGLLKPDQGQILLQGKPIENYSAAERARLIGMIPQLHTPAFAYTVAEMVMMGRASHLGWMESPSKTDQIIVEEALEQVGLFELRDRPYTEISGGERQLVLIARGLAQQCRILLMDEPTAHLDLSNQHRILEIVNQLSRQGLSFIVSTHAPNEALSYADRVLLLNGGWVTESGPPKAILTEPVLSSVYGISTEVIYEWVEGMPVPRAVVPRRPITMFPESINDPDSELSAVFRKSETDPQLILVTGLKGAGKTTWCTQLSALANEKGLDVQGILSPGRYSDQRKIGIDVMDLKTGEQRPLANLREKDSEGILTPRWTFVSETLMWANQLLEKVKDSDLVIIDEIGPIELLRNEGFVAGLDLIDQERYRVACVAVRPSMLPKILQRWPKALVVSGNAAAAK